MSYKQRPYQVTDGGTGSATASGARTNLAVPLNTNTMLLDGTQAMTADMLLGGFKITNLGTPSGAADAATKGYVDGLATGLDVKYSCRAATTANITLSGAQTIDGVSIIAGNRVLVKNQTTAANNGIYVAASGAWSRSTDADASIEVTSGMFTFIEEGTLYTSTGWVLTTANPITLGTTSLSFSQFSDATAWTAGGGLVLTGSTLDVVGTTNRILVNADSVDISPNYVGQASIVTVGTITTGTWDGTDVAVTAGGTGSSTASGARSNLSAAPNSATYLVASTNSELANADVATAGSGVTINTASNVTTFAVDTAVVATTTNTLTMSNKTLTSPIINNPKIAHSISTKTADYTLTSADDVIAFNISSGKAATLMDVTTVTGYRFTIKNRFDSTANVTVTAGGADTIDTAATYVLVPGDAIDVISDGARWLVV